MPTVLYLHARLQAVDPRLPFTPHSPDDEAGYEFVGWWRRMHQGRRPLAPVALKPVVIPGAHEKPSTRYLFEVCRWPLASHDQWTFVCWMIDSPGLWIKAFPTKKAALAYFRQPVETVLR